MVDIESSGWSGVQILLRHFKLCNFMLSCSTLNVRKQLVFIWLWNLGPSLEGLLSVANK